MSIERSIWSWSQELHPFLRGWMVAMLAFIALGTVSAIWANPLFVRMTLVGAWEFPALALLAVLTGVFFALPNTCGLRRATAGGTAGFLGIACPTCNKILMLIFGGEALLLWFDPMRPYVTAGGIAVLFFRHMAEMALISHSRTTLSKRGLPMTIAADLPKTPS